MKLVIVESPNKCQTISRYLGEDYKVLASKGHIRDLATCGKGGLGIDPDNDFLATYKVSSSKLSTINELKSAKKNCKEVILATDPDREGEAIAWHLAQVLDLDVENVKRLEFHEITRESLEEAISSPRTIDMNLVNSQEARRIIDRVLGFKLSTLMQKKLKTPSAGRVQSATLKLICEREQEITSFIPEDYWTLKLKLKKNAHTFEVNVYKYNDKNVEIKTEEFNNELISKINKQIDVTKATKTIKKVESKPPFTTSSLQQEAFNVYRFSTAKTAMLAQKLYEGINVNGEHVGLITYIRTDSIRLSDNYVNKTVKYIEETFGQNYVGTRKTDSKALRTQDAHEAIRPTSNFRTPLSLKSTLTNDLYKLYKLIYERAVSSLMTAKQEEVETIVFETNGLTFKTEFTRTVFDGYTILSGKNDNLNDQIPSINVGDKFDVIEIINEKKQTEPPARLTEAKVVKLMEEKGIGRPSTYSATITTLQKRKYIISESGSIVPTETGLKTNHVLEKYFPELISVKYTADMETQLDDIQDGSHTRSEVLTSFYYPFMELFNKVSNVMYEDDKKLLDRKCPKCGAPLAIKDGKYGQFVGCSNFPKCDYIEKEEQKNDECGETCPLCGAPLVYRFDKKGKKFIGCSNYPTCLYTKSIGADNEIKYSEKTCPRCGKKLILKSGKYSKYYECEDYPNCNYRESLRKFKK